MREAQLSFILFFFLFLLGVWIIYFNCSVLIQKKAAGISTELKGTSIFLVGKQLFVLGIALGAQTSCWSWCLYYTIAVVDLMNRDEQCNKNPLGEVSCRCITILLLWQVSMSFNPNVLRIFHSHVNYDSLTWPFLYILYLVIVWYLKPLAVNLLLKLSGRVMRRAISRLRWLF